jgi:hypothetical protein
MPVTGWGRETEGKKEAGPPRLRKKMDRRLRAGAEQLEREWGRIVR